MFRRAGLAALWFAAFLANAPLHAQTPLHDATVATLPTDLAPVGIAISDDGRLISVAEHDKARTWVSTVGCVAPDAPPSRTEIETFDAASRTRVGAQAVPLDIPAAGSPRQVGVDPARRLAYVARGERAEIDVIDAITGALVRTFSTGLTQAASGAIDPARRRLYLVGTGADEILNNRVVNQRVLAIDLATEQPVGAIVLANIHAARVDPATGRLWVLSTDANATTDSPSHAVVFDPNTLMELARVTVGRCASGLAFDQARQLAYVTNEADRSISVLDMTRVRAQPAALAAPTDLRAAVNATAVNLTWESIPGAASYDVEAGSDRGITNLAVVHTTGLGLTVTLPPGTYYFRVRAKLPGGTASDASNEVAVTIAVTTAAPLVRATPLFGTGARPSDAVPCHYAVGPTTATAGAAGGSLTIGVTDTAGTNCAWAVFSDSDFLTVTTGASGTGAGSVQVGIAPLDGDPRMGSIYVDGQRVTVMQCAHAVTPASASVDAIGGTLAFAVTTQGGCDWTVTSNNAFLLVNPGTGGSGNGSAQVTATENTGAARSGSVTIAGQTLTITQAGAGGQCAYAVTPASAAAPAGGGDLVFTITTQTGCAWTAASHDGFLTMTGATSGTGSGAVTVTAATNAGDVRSGTVTIADQSVPVTQDAAGPASCALSVAPANASVPAGGGALTLTVNRTAGSGCNWTAASTSSFLTFPDGTSGVDDAPIAVGVAANTGAVRSGTLTVAGRTVTVTQDGAASPSCTYVVAPSSQPVRPGGDRALVRVVVAEGTACTWTAVANTGFLTVSEMPPLTGGFVTVTVAPNGGVARAGTLTVAGQTVTFDQESSIPSCAFDLPTNYATAPAGGGAHTFQIANTQGVNCSWTAASNSGFLTITSGSSGTGSGSVTVAAAANNGVDRMGTLTVAGATVTVAQDGISGCAFDVTPRNVTVSQPSGGAVTFTVTSTAGTNCGWTAISPSGWLTITSGSSGTGSGSVTVQAAAADVPFRSATLIVAGREVTVNQDSRSVCTFDVTPATTTVSGSGGAATFTVNNPQGTSCGWTAVSNSSFLTVTSGSEGTGSGSVTVTAASNSGAVRSGTVTIAERVVTIVQDAPGCAFDVSPTAETVAAAGGARTFTVTNTQGASCTWTASSSSAFLTITSGSSGTGSGSVTVTASANIGAERPGTVTIAGRTITITQLATENCAFTVGPSSIVVSSSSDTKTVTVTAIQGATCGWTAVSNSAFLTVTAGSSGTGSGSVTVAIAAHTGTSQRSGTLAIAGQTVTVNQDPPPQQPAQCYFTIDPRNLSLPASGGTRTLTVTRTEGTNCAWTMVSQDAFITVTSGASGTGSGTVTFSVAANTGVARSGTLALQIAGTGGVTSVNVTQEQAVSCAISVTPRNEFVVPASGGTVTFTVTSTGSTNCSWTAAVNGATWLTIVSGSSGTGSGSVTVRAAEYTVPGYRSGNLTIAGTEVWVNQDGRVCTSNVTPATASVPGSGGTATFSVSNTGGCLWTAVSNSSFLTVSSGSSGSGSGSVTVTAASNGGAVRSGTLTIADRVVTIVQDSAGCTFDVTPTAANVPAGGGTSTFTVTNTQGSGCTWTAASNSSFVTVTSGSAGTGSGSVTVSASNNVGAERSGTVTIAGRTVTVTQSAAVNCAFTVSPGSIVVSANGESRTFTVTAAQSASCTWTAVSNSAFLTVTGGSSGTGSGSGTVAIAAYSGSSQRSGTLTIAGQTVTVRQDPPPQPAPCYFTIDPRNLSLPASGGTRTLTVTRTEGTNCAWTMVSQNAFITVTSGASGTGSGTVTFSVAENTGVARSGTLALQIAGTGGVTSVNVTQEKAVSCAISVTPRNEFVVPPSGGTVTFTVTSTGGTCNWTAVGNGYAWLTITSGSSGTGSGSVTVQASAYAGGGYRSGTLTIAGTEVTVNQDGRPCTFDVAPTAASVPGSGGTATFAVTNTQGAGCSWTASTSASFLTITGGASGTGNGTVTVSAALNGGAARTGTAVIAGRTVTVTQAGN